MIRALRIAVVAIAASAVSLLVFPAYLATRAGDTKIVEPQQFDFVLMALGAAALAIGAQLVPWRRGTYATVLAVLTGAGLLFGIMGAFSIGAPFFAASVVILLVLFRVLRRSTDPSTRPAAVGGALIGYALVVLYIGSAVPPVVECFPNGGGTSSGRWFGGSAVTIGGGMRMGPDGSMTGTIEAPTWSATFRCEGGRIVQFERVSR